MKRPRLRRLVRFVLRCSLALFLASLLFVIVLRFIRPPASALMVERRIESWTSDDKYSSNYRWTSIDKIAPVMGVAVIAAEDQNFLQHYGFDWQAIQKAIDHNEQSNRTRGASTITQQTAKNLFLWPGRDWTRKGVE